jgi:hypothetical protein
LNGNCSLCIGFICIALRLFSFCISKRIYVWEMVFFGFFFFWKETWTELT